MRTTVVIDSDVAGEIERLRREGMGLSEALNLLARRGMARGTSSETGTYTHRTSRIGLKVDVTNIADVLDRDLTPCVGHAQSQDVLGGSEMIQRDGKEKLSRRVQA